MVRARRWCITMMGGRRCFSTDITMRGRFYNREKELAALQKAISPRAEGDVGRILLLTGPKDSGKSALLRQFWARQRSGIYDGIPAFVDMRLRSNLSPASFARNLATSFLRSVQLKVEVGNEDLWGIKSKWGTTISAHSLAVDTPWGKVEFLNKEARDPVDMVMEGFENFLSLIPAAQVWKGFYATFPTIFVDEANALASWGRGNPGGAQNVEALLRFFMWISKQECGANVVLASSENFFKEWLTGSAVFQGHGNIQVATVGHLTEEEARNFVSFRIHDLDHMSSADKKEVEKQVMELWPDVFTHLGGAMVLLSWFVHDTARPGMVKEEWEAFKMQQLQNARQFIRSGLYPLALSHVLIASHSGSPAWTRDDWKTVICSIAEAEDGAISYNRIIERISPAALNSLIEYNFLNYRTFSGWDRDVSNVPSGDWPIVLPNSKLEHVAMKELQVDIGRPL